MHRAHVTYLLLRGLVEQSLGFSRYLSSDTDPSHDIADN